MGRVSATYADGPTHNQFVFSLLPSSDAAFFHIDAHTGDIITSLSLDREQQNWFSLLVKVADPQMDALSSTAEVAIRVTDVNDNLPRIQGDSSITLQVPNTLDEGSTVHQVIAFDDDIGDNSRLAYRIAEELSDDVNVTALFQIDSCSGVVRSAQTLWDAVGSHIKLLIEVSDLGVVPNQINTELHIHVTQP